MKIIVNLCASVFLAGAVLVPTASAQAIDDTPIDPVAVANGSAGGSRRFMARAISLAR